MHEPPKAFKRHVCRIREIKIVAISSLFPDRSWPRRTPDCHRAGIPPRDENSLPKPGSIRPPSLSLQIPRRRGPNVCYLKQKVDGQTNRTSVFRVPCSRSSKESSGRKGRSRSCRLRPLSAGQACDSICMTKGRRHDLFFVDVFRERFSLHGRSARRNIRGSRSGRLVLRWINCR